MHINGNNQNNGRIARSAYVGKTVKVDVLRCAEGQRFYLRTLAHEYGGLFTHWYKGDSQICRGKECFEAMHRLPRVWKGYTPVLAFDKILAVWFPKVFEITEHLELDFRGLFAKGQEWLISRDAPVKGKVQPVTGLLRVAEVRTSLPPAFDMSGVLRNLYRAEQIDLTHANPKPPRTYAEPFEGDAPEDLAEQLHREESEEQQHSADQRSFQERAAERAKQRGKLPS